MTKRDPRIGLRFLVGFHGLTAPDYILDWLREERIAGVILFARNVESPQQLAALTRSLHEAAPHPIFVAIDQEGGMVARLRMKNGFSESPGAMALAAARDEALTERVSRLLADEMRAVGINWTFAPVVDLSYNAENPTVGTRSFGRDPQQVGQLASNATRGFQAGGVIACAKHFPGLGNTRIDSHLDLPTLDTATETLIADDLEPYRQVVAADIASIMTTHTVFSDLDTTYPATLSPTIITRLLRDELAYQGVVITDCLEMHAITKHYGEGESAVLGALAGVDMLLISHTRSHQEAAFAAVEQAIAEGRISDDNLQAAAERITTLREQFTLDPTTINPDAVGTEAHHAQMLAAAKAGVNLIGTLPPMTGSVAVIEFASHMESEVMEREEPTSFAAILADVLPNAQTVALHAVHPTETQIAAARAAIERTETVIVVTRNAHMVDAQRTATAHLLALKSDSVLVALRNPYDADVLQAKATLCTFGDSVPSLHAAALALAGQFQPDGQRPAIAEV